MPIVLVVSSPLICELAPGTENHATETIIVETSPVQQTSVVQVDDDMIEDTRESSQT